MLYRRLGRSELSVSAVAFGTSQLRMIEDAQAVATLRAGIDLGVNLIHTAPDYEGAEALVARAIRESGRDVLICTQAYDVHGNKHGRVRHFERLFEQACKTFGRDTIDLFGIACIDDREALDENVWGRGGMVEFLERRKREGRIRATFCSTHGDPSYVARLIDAGVFDAIMLAYNPLGFHLLSLHAPPGRSFENLAGTQSEIFPLADRRGVGLMIMKPLGGGLLGDGRSFRADAEVLPPRRDDVRARDVLRAILRCPGVTCVVPGTTSLDEAVENASAGHEPLADPEAIERSLAARVQELRAAVCSRCGSCDDLCSRDLPISWMFRAGYLAQSRFETHETWDDVRYFGLHPDAALACASCTNVTCACPAEIDIPENLRSLHATMLNLAERGIVHRTDDPAPPTGRRPRFGAKLLMRDLPAAIGPNSTHTCRLQVANVGRLPWPRHGPTRVVVDWNGRRTEIAPRDDVLPGSRTHFVFSLAAPVEPNDGALRISFVDERGHDELLHEARIPTRSRP